MKDLKNGSGLTSAFAVLDGLVNGLPPSPPTREAVLAALITPRTRIERVRFRGDRVIVIFKTEDVLAAAAASPRGPIE